MHSTDIDLLITKWGNITDAYRKWQKADEKARRSGAGTKDLPKSYKYASELAWLSDFNKRERFVPDTFSQKKLLKKRHLQFAHPFSWSPQSSFNLLTAGLD